MNIFLTLLFAIELALLLTHEMDAVRHKEWMLFIGLRNLPEQTAYWVFTLPHILLYALLFFLLLSANTALFYVIDIFLIGHLVLHFLFRKHPNNQLTGFISLLIIYSAGIIAGLHLVLLILFN
ncbi:DUF6713 family protein [Enterococcus malodoratus]|uniref:HXXEE domain-containing protein n=1 Tax=Enterococcus malodoratus ATCC 43197 TaxID=1158601 RepID=R2NVY6_9ENTE|nr:DUF6713 family protein [Enterococcus malodoratus]EOH75173.1 hypothetical protein UAI_02975 [Enterococcus malodoratus ATCC 43197]EOT66635.1 hypothetical protein I585_02156 [Enterococcus malodoratus ATCC 43197]OJG66072.1 hypothetical protein RV07_GL001659 [Enterococcus malodoratus]SES75847.1 hypothetical protein SAMN04487821_102178 [Enterococcus malodoratus]SPW90657.1 Uncharacterised protein [Enterococcus malodoratus]